MPITDPIYAGQVASDAAWRELVKKGLRGRPFTDLVATTAEGLAIQPLQLPAGPLRVGGRGGVPWTRLQRIDHPDAERSASLALAALNGGAAGLVLVMHSAPGGRGFGMAPGDLPAVLSDVLIDACAIRLEAGTDGADRAQNLADEVSRRRLDPALLDISFGIDPISAAAAAGSGLADWPRARSTMTAAISRFVAAGYRGPFVSADGRRAHEAGADAASELAFVLAATVAYLRMLAEADLEPQLVARAVDVVLSADSDQFLTLAKFRAIRLLVHRIRVATGLPSAPLNVHGETSFRMTTRLDAHSNLIRAAIAALAAGAAGADSLCVLPFTAPFGLAGEAPRRLALDTQSILIEEANLCRVADPSAGSGSIEALTGDLAHEAWRRFQAIEREGGLIASLAEGRLQQRIAAERQARAAGVADGSFPIIGTNLFRAPLPSPVEVDAPFPPPVAAGGEFEPLRAHRDSEASESEVA